MSEAILFVVFTLTPLICVFGFLGFLSQQIPFCSDEDEIWIDVDLSRCYTPFPSPAKQKAETAVVSAIILSVFIFIGCSSEEPTCEDYVDDQLSMMVSIADQEEFHGSVVEYCWGRGLDVNLEECDCMPSGSVEEFALRRCTPAEFSWLLEAASLAVGSCNEEFSHR